MKISFFQYLPKFNSFKENLIKISELIDTNLKEIAKTRVLVFPEYSFTGPLNLETFNQYKKEKVFEDAKSEFAKLSTKLPSTSIVFGSMIIPDGNEFHNSSPVYLNGEELGSYSKKALIYNENYVCASNTKYPVFEVDGIKIGLAICWDLILPEVFRHYISLVDLVIIPSFWGLGGNKLQAQYSFSLEKKYYRELCVARAYENAYGVLFVNSVGKYESSFYSDRMMGGSMAVMPPQGEVFFTSSKRPNELQVVDLDFSELRKFRKYYATDKDFRYYRSRQLF